MLRAAILAICAVLMTMAVSALAEKVQDRQKLDELRSLQVSTASPEPEPRLMVTLAGSYFHEYDYGGTNFYEVELETNFLFLNRFAWETRLLDLAIVGRKPTESDINDHFLAIYVWYDEQAEDAQSDVTVTCFERVDFVNRLWALYEHKSIQSEPLQDIDQDHFASLKTSSDPLENSIQIETSVASDYLHFAKLDCEIHRVEQVYAMTFALNDDGMGGLRSANFILNVTVYDEPDFDRMMDFRTFVSVCNFDLDGNVAQEFHAYYNMNLWECYMDTTGVCELEGDQLQQRLLVWVVQHLFGSIYQAKYERIVLQAEQAQIVYGFCNLIEEPGCELLTKPKLVFSFIDVMRSQDVHWGKFAERYKAFTSTTILSNQQTSSAGGIYDENVVLSTIYDSFLYGIYSVLLGTQDGSEQLKFFEINIERLRLPIMTINGDPYSSTINYDPLTGLYDLSMVSSTTMMWLAAYSDTEPDGFFVVSETEHFKDNEIIETTDPFYDEVNQLFFFNATDTVEQANRAIQLLFESKVPPPGQYRVGLKFIQNSTMALNIQGDLGKPLTPYFDLIYVDFLLINDCIPAEAENVDEFIFNRTASKDNEVKVVLEKRLPSEIPRLGNPRTDCPQPVYYQLFLQKFIPKYTAGVSYDVNLVDELWNMYLTPYDTLMVNNFNQLGHFPLEFKAIQGIISFSSAPEKAYIGEYFFTVKVYIFESLLDKLPNDYEVSYSYTNVIVNLDDDDDKDDTTVTVIVTDDTDTTTDVNNNGQFGDQAMTDINGDYTDDTVMTAVVKALQDSLKTPSVRYSLSQTIVVQLDQIVKQFGQSGSQYEDYNFFLRACRPVDLSASVIHNLAEAKLVLQPINASPEMLYLQFELENGEYTATVMHNVLYSEQSETFIDDVIDDVIDDIIDEFSQSNFDKELGDEKPDEDTEEENVTDDSQEETETAFSDPYSNSTSQTDVAPNTTVLIVDDKTDFVYVQSDPVTVDKIVDDIKKVTKDEDETEVQLEKATKQFSTQLQQTNYSYSNEQFGNLLMAAIDIVAQEVTLDKGLKQIGVGQNSGDDQKEDQLQTASKRVTSDGRFSIVFNYPLTGLRFLKELEATFKVKGVVSDKFYDEMFDDQGKPIIQKRRMLKDNSNEDSESIEEEASEMSVEEASYELSKFLKFTVFRANEYSASPNELGFQVLFDDYDEQTIDFRIEFDSPELVSQQSRRDFMVAEVMHENFFKSVEKDSMINVGTLYFFELPKLLESVSDAEFYEVAKQTVETTTQTIVFGQVVLFVFVSISLKQMWNLLNTMQIYTMSQNFTDWPARVDTILQFFKEAITLNKVSAYFFSIGMTKFEVVKQFTQDEFLSEQGIGQSHFTRSLGIIGLAFAFILLLFIIYFIANICKRKCKCCDYLLYKMHKQLFYSIPYRYMSTGYLYLMINVSAFACAEVKNEDPDSKVIVFYLLLIALLILWPLWTIKFLFSNQDKLKDPNFRRKHHSLYDGIKTHTLLALLFQAVFTVIRFDLVLMNLVLSADSPFTKTKESIYLLKIFCLMGIVILYLCYIHISWPHDEPVYNVLEFFNQYMLLLLSYLMLFFTEIFPVMPSYQANQVIGRFSICIVFAVVVVNFGFMMKLSIGKVYLRLVKCKKQKEHSLRLSSMLKSKSVKESKRLKDVPFEKNEGKQAVQKRVSLKMESIPEEREDEDEVESLGGDFGAVADPMVGVNVAARKYASQKEIELSEIQPLTSSLESSVEKKLCMSEKLTTYQNKKILPQLAGRKIETETISEPEVTTTKTVIPMAAIFKRPQQLQQKVNEQDRILSMLNSQEIDISLLLNKGNLMASVSSNADSLLHSPRSRQVLRITQATIKVELEDQVQDDESAEIYRVDPERVEQILDFKPVQKKQSNSN